MWENKLYQLEQERSWDEAISYIQNIIKINSCFVDAYLSLQFLLMSLLG